MNATERALEERIEALEQTSLLQTSLLVKVTENQGKLIEAVERLTLAAMPRGEKP